MKTITLGRTGLKVSRNAFGALPIQRVSFDEAARLLRRAYDAGVNYFDTANAYTDSEEKIGYALADVRDKIKVEVKSTAYLQSWAQNKKSTLVALPVLECVDPGLEPSGVDQ